jgi:hypothetical protein
MIAILTGSLGADMGALSWIPRYVIGLRLNPASVSAMSKDAVGAVRTVFERTRVCLQDTMNASQRDNLVRRLISSFRSLWIDFEATLGQVPPRDIYWNMTGDMIFADIGFWVRAAQSGALSEKEAGSLMTKISAITKHTGNFPVFRSAVRNGKTQSAISLYSGEYERLTALLSQHQNRASTVGRSSQGRDLVLHILQTSTIPLPPEESTNSNAIQNHVSMIVMLASGEFLQGRIPNARKLLDHILYQSDSLSFDNLVWVLAERLCLGQLEPDSVKDFVNVLDSVLSNSRSAALDETMLEESFSVILGANAPLSQMQCLLSAVYSWLPFLAEKNTENLNNMRMSFLSLASKRLSRFHPAFPTRYCPSKDLSVVPLSLHTLPMPHL